MKVVVRKVVPNDVVADSNSTLKSVFGEHIRGPLVIKNSHGRVVFEGALMSIGPMGEYPKHLLFSLGSYNRFSDQRITCRDTIRELMETCGLYNKEDEDFSIKLGV